MRLSTSVIVGAAGKFASSTDASTFTQSTQGSVQFKGIAFSPELGLFAMGGGAAGGTAVIYTSPDVVTWTSRTTNFSATNTVNSLCFRETHTTGGQNYIAVGTGGQISTSPDGVTWTARTSGFGATVINDVAAAYSYTVMVGAAGKISFGTGTTYTLVTTSGFGATDINGIATSSWGVTSGNWVAVGAAGTLTTADEAVLAGNTAWTAKTSGFGANAINDIAYSITLDRWVIVGAAGTLATSNGPTGASWSLRTSGFGSEDINCVEFCPVMEQFVAGGANGTVRTSTDGITWSSATSNFGGSAIFGVRGAPSCPRFIAAGTLGAASSLTNVSPSLPSFLQDDIAIMAIMTNDANSFSSVVGWTNFGLNVNNANSSTAWFWRRLVTGDVAPTPAISTGVLSNSNGMYARIYVFRDCYEGTYPFMNDVGFGGARTPQQNGPTLGTVVSYTSVQAGGSTVVPGQYMTVAITCNDDDNAWSAATMPDPGAVNIGGLLTSTTGGDCGIDAIVRIPYNYHTAVGTGTSNVPGTVMATMAASDYATTLSVMLAPVYPVATTSFPLVPASRRASARQMITR